MVHTVSSVRGIPIRLPAERWAHITEEHCELAGMREEILEAVAEPTSVLMGNHGALLAAKEREDGKILVVVYREANGDGFIITAFLTSRRGFLDRRTKVWPP